LTATSTCRPHTPSNLHYLSTNPTRAIAIIDNEAHDGHHQPRCPQPLPLRDCH
jgi:hypothetical protein